MNYITLFETENQYNSARDRLLVPNVSYISGTDRVVFMKEHFVDFGTDAVAKIICIENWDTNHDGELSFAEAAAVPDIGTTFRRTLITDAMFLRCFTGITGLVSEAFREVTGLTRIAIPANVQSIGNNCFYQDNAIKDYYYYWKDSIPAATDLQGLSSWSSSLEHIYIPKGTTSMYSANLRFAYRRDYLVELDEMP